MAINEKEMTINMKESEILCENEIGIESQYQ